MKSLVAKYLAKRIKDGVVVGLGSGSTVELAIEQIGARIAKEGIRVLGVPSSHRTAVGAAQAGIEVLSPVVSREISWTFDGADEVDPQGNLIKGRGGAMLSEKIIAKRARELVIIITEDKLVERLGTQHPVPVEVVPEAFGLAQAGLKDLGAHEVKIREAANKYGPVISEHNNLILDAWFDKIEPEFESAIKSLTGVVDSGLFIGFAPELLIARQDGVWSRRIVNDKPEETLVEQMNA